MAPFGNSISLILEEIRNTQRDPDHMLDSLTKVIKMIRKLESHHLDIVERVQNKNLSLQRELELFLLYYTFTNACRHIF